MSRAFPAQPEDLLCFRAEIFRDANQFIVDEDPKIFNFNAQTQVLAEEPRHSEPF